MVARLQGRRSRHENTRFVVAWANVEYYAVPPEERPYLYNRVHAFLKVPIRPHHSIAECIVLLVAQDLAALYG